MTYRLKRQLERHAAARRLQAPMPSDVVWKQWGAPLVSRYPCEEWPAQIVKIPTIYRSTVVSRLIRQYGYTVDA